MVKGERLLASDFRACQQKWVTCTGAQHLSASLRLDDGSVHFQVPMPGGNSVAVSVLLLSCGSYPDSPAIADCQDDAAVSAKLAEVNEYYEESATLPAVLTHIFRVLRAGQYLRSQSCPL